VFVDAGNVYYSGNNKGFGCSPSGKTCSTNSGPVRFSTGLEADLITPFGPVGLSLAKPLNLRKGDDQEIFQLSLGANF
jgi:outer membrane protein insertion porin family